MRLSHHPSPLQSALPFPLPLALLLLPPQRPCLSAALHEPSDEMPVFSDPDLMLPGDGERRMRDDRYGYGRSSDQATPTEDVEMWDRPRESRSTSPTKAVLAAIDDTSLGISDRVELIERIKRGESPTWRPNGAVSDSRAHWIMKPLARVARSWENSILPRLVSLVHLRQTREQQQQHQQQQHRPCAPSWLVRPSLIS